LGAVAAVYAVAGGSGLIHAQAAALAFAALICGNLGLVALHRAPPKPGGMPPARNPAFLIVVAIALGAIAAISLLPVPARWFGFEPVALPWLAFAAAVPLSVLALLRLATPTNPGAARTRHGRGRNQT